MAGAFQRLAANRLALAGTVLLAFILLLLALAPFLPLPDPDLTDPARRLLPPGSEGAILGTDQLGRDLLARLLSGTAVSLGVGLSATLAAAIVGSAIGLVAGYAGGWADGLLMRGVDLVMAFPYILLALAIVAILGPGLMNALYAVAIVNVPFFARNVRGAALGLARREFVDAARLTGASSITILFVELLPNLLPTIVVAMSMTMGWMILETAGLSFLGLGAQPPQADLGAMLGEGRKFLFTAPHVTAIPGAMILLLTVAINLLGDGVRDLLDPRLRRGALAAPGAATETGPDVASPPPYDGRLLDVRGLSVRFPGDGGAFKAVDGLDLDLAPGERVGVVGESGAGKSVAAMSVFRLAPSPPAVIASGSVAFEGEDMLAAAPARLRRTRGGRAAYVFQDPATALHPLFTVGDQLAEAIRAHGPVARGAARDRAAALLEAVQIPSARARLDAYPHELSGGMRQRVAIAMALANDPALIVADEPTTALDVTIQAEILDLLRRLSEDRGAAILFISHDLGVVAELTDRIAVMYAGRIVEAGPTAAVLAQPAHPYTRALVDCAPVLGAPERRLDAIEGAPPPADDLPPGCAFAPRCRYVEARCRAGDIPLDRVAPERAARCVKPLGDAA